MSAPRGSLAALASIVALVVVVAVGACSVEEILLVTLPEGGASPDATTPEPPRGPPCDDDRACPADAFCARPTCDSRGKGFCDRRPAFCDGSPLPVCGCNGITYWNDCLRRTRGERSSTPGECAPPRAAICGERGGRPCPPGSTCARIAATPSGQPCPPDLPGTCWALPAVCPPASGVDRFVKCGMPGPGPAPPGACVDLCEAIRAGQPHARAESCP